MRLIHRMVVAGAAACCLLGGGLLFSPAAALAGEGLGIVGSFGSASSTPADPYPLSLVKADEFNEPGSGVAVSSTGDVYVADTANNRVEWFSSSGQYEGQFDGSGKLANEGGKKAPSALSGPEDIAVDDGASSPSKGDVYVLDASQGVIDKFSATGEFLFQWSGAWRGIAVGPSGDVWARTAGKENAPAILQEFSNAVENMPIGSPRASDVLNGEHIAVDSEENLYLSASTVQVDKVSKTGAALGEICGECGGGGLAVDPANNDLFVDQGSLIEQYGPFGMPFDAPEHRSKPDSLEGGAGIAVSPVNHEVYVADAASNEIFVFALGPGPEAPETLAASEVKGKSAVLHGKLDPHGAQGALEYHFVYSTEGTCTGAANAGTTPVPQGMDAEAKEASVQAEAKGLEPNAKYTDCLVAENAFESTTGNEVSFETAAAPPEIISESAGTPPEEEALLVFSATIEPNHSTNETTYYFEYSTEGSVTGNTLTGNIQIAPGQSTIPPEEFGEQSISSKKVYAGDNGETIYYRVVASNGNGNPETGKVQAYTKVPIVFSEASSGLTLTTATLEAKISPDFKTTHYYFECATSVTLLEGGKGTLVPGGSIEPQGGGSEFEELPVSAVASGLTPNTLYYYRVVAENELSKKTDNINKGEPIRGEPERFTTESLPFVSTGAAQSASRTSETFSGTVTPIDQNTTYYFQYISETAYQAALKGDAEERADPFLAGETTASLSLAAGTAPQTVGPVPASGLLSEETYRYRIVANNKFGVRYGEPGTFTTGTKVLPAVSTGSASAVAQNSATLSGTVATNGLQTSYGFEIGTEPGNYGPATGLGSIGGSSTEEVSVTLSELQPGTTYYYRITASNADGTSQGQPETFTTLGFPTPLTIPVSQPLVALPSIAFPKEEATRTTAKAKSLTKAQKLARALAACHTRRGKRRSSCEAAARKKYGAKKARKKRGRR